MIIVPLKEGENIEKALKKFKRKYEKTGVVKELRRRQEFRKPSVVKRERRSKTPCCLCSGNAPFRRLNELLSFSHNIINFVIQDRNSVE